MRKYLLLALCLLESFNIFGQIDIATSTVKVIGYWNENDSRIYSISEEKYVITGSDTTSREHVSYKVDIVIIDSSPNSYTIEWSYRDYSMTTDNPLLQKLSSIYGNRKVIIKTDKKGSFIEVVNWKDFKKLISNLNYA